MSKKEKSVEELLDEALVPEEEWPYEVPGNWVWVRLGFGYAECLDRFRKPINAKERANRVGSIPYYGATGQVGWIDEYLTNEELVLVGEDGAPFLDPFKSKAYMISGKAWVNNHAHLLKSSFGHTGNIYLKHYLNQFNYHGYVSGTTRLKLNQKNLLKIPVPLPPLTELNRITKKVELFLGKMNQAKQLIEDAKETFELRRAAILDKAFSGELTKNWRKENKDIEAADILYKRIQDDLNKGKARKKIEIDTPSELPDLPIGWKWVKLEQILEVNPPKKKMNDIPDEQQCSFIPMASVNDETGKIDSMEERPFSKVKKGYTFFLEGDVIFAKITPCMENGKSAIVKGLNNGFGYGSTEFYVLRTNEFINEKLIHFLVRSRKFRSEAKAVMTGAVGQQRVPKNFIENYLFPLPPLDEQNEIVNILENLSEREEEINRSINLEDHIEMLKQSVLSKAFRGELGTSDLTEEGAMELLKDVL